MPDPETPLTADQPWRGAEPYTEADRAFFYGRRREAEELRHLLQRDAITLLTGAVGLGKTSLVRAGLLPSLSPDWLPVPLVLDWAAASDQKPLNRQVVEAIEAAAQARGIAGPKSNPADSLWEVFHRSGSRWWNARQRPVTPILVLDQFENAFTAGVANATAQRHRDRFFDELSQLVANRPPSRIALRIEDGTEREDAFDFGPVPVRVVLVMREDVLPELITLRPLFPTLERSELRLTAFTEAQARDALVRAGAQRGLFAEGVVDQLLPRIATGNDREHPFAPAALSVQARELAEHRTRRNAAQITSDFLAPTQPAQAAPTAKPAAAPASTKAEPPPAVPAKRHSPALVPLLLLLFAVVGVSLWQQQQLRHDFETVKARVIPAEPATVETTPAPDPEPTPEPPPRVVIAEATPTPAPATPAPATPMPATPTPAPMIVTATPPPATPAPMPEFTPEPGATTTIVPAGPTPAPATPIPAPEPPTPMIPAPATIKPARKPPEAARQRERERAEPPKRPTTTTVVPPAAPPPRPSTPRKPAFVPGSGN